MEWGSALPIVVNHLICRSPTNREALIIQRSGFGLLEPACGGRVVGWCQ